MKYENVLRHILKHPPLCLFSFLKLVLHCHLAFIWHRLLFFQVYSEQSPIKKEVSAICKDETEKCSKDNFLNLP